MDTSGSFLVMIDAARNFTKGRSNTTMWLDTLETKPLFHDVRKASVIIRKAFDEITHR